MERILMTKVKNAIKKSFGTDVEFKLSNININGDKRGCSGFITNPANGVTVYVDTEECKPYGIMYRYAKDNKDYTGCRNRWSHDFGEYIGEICKLLKNEAEFGRELASYRKA